MQTVLDLCRAAARKANIIASGEELDAAQGQDALECLKLMLDTWALNKLNVFRVVQIEIPITSGLNTYTIGPTGDVVVELPARIEAYADMLVGAVKYRSKIKRDLELKTPHFQSPASLFGMSGFSCEECIEYSVSSDTWSFKVNNQIGASSLRLYAESLPSKLELEDNLSFPQGYERALVFNLAVDIAEEYGMSASVKTQQIADSSFAQLKRSNAQPIRTNGDATLLRMGRNCGVRYRG